MANPSAGKGEDTTLGGFARDFPRTTAGFLDRVVRRFGPENREGVEELCRRYWKPVYFFIRVSWAKTNEDAKDLTQAFFAWLLEGDVLGRYRSERAPFRAFLKGLLRRFVADEQKSSRRLKRGGATNFVRFDGQELGLESLIADPNAANPDRVFDQAWQVALVKYAVDSVRRRLVEQGRELHFRLFEEYDFPEGPKPPSSAELGTRFGLTDRQVRNILAAVRAAVREEIRAELARQTCDPKEFEEEWNALLGS